MRLRRVREVILGHSLKAKYNALILGPIWASDGYAFRERYPIDALRGFLMGYTTIAMSLPGPRFRVTDEPYENRRSPYPYRPDELAQAMSIRMLREVTGTDVARADFTLPVRRLPACPLDDGDLAHLLGLGCLDGPIDSLFEIAGATGDLDPWAAYDGGGIVAGTLSIGLGRVLAVTLDRRDMDRRSVEILLKAVGAVHRNPRMVPYTAVFEREHGYRGNFFTADAPGMLEGPVVRLEPVHAHLLDKLLLHRARTQVGWVHVNNIRDEMLEETRKRSMEEPRKIVKAINRRFFEHLSHEGLRPYDVIQVRGDGLCRMRFRQNFRVKAYPRISPARICPPAVEASNGTLGYL